MDNMDVKDPTPTKIKQERQDIKEEVSGVVKVEPGEVKEWPLTKFQYRSTGSGNVGPPNVQVKRGDINIDIKVDDNGINITINSSKPNNFIEKKVIKTERFDEKKVIKTERFDEDKVIKTENLVEGKVIKTEEEEDDININVTTVDNLQKKPSKCELCGIVCRNSDGSSLHMIYHSGEQRFKCDKAIKSEEQLECTEPRTEYSHKSTMTNGNGPQKSATSSPIELPSHSGNIGKTPRQKCVNVLNEYSSTDDDDDAPGEPISKKFRYGLPTYVSLKDSSDPQNPRRVRVPVEILESVIEDQREEIKSLQEENERLLKKSQALEELVKQLRKKD